jgi:type IV pilus assembly protein PilB
MLVMAGLVEERDLRAALVEQTRRRVPVGKLLVERGQVSEDDLALLLGRQLGIEVIDLDRTTPEPAALARLAPEQARQLGVVPLKLADRAIDVAMCEPNDQVVAQLTLKLGLAVRPRICAASMLDRALDRWYPRPA